jgi:hypothetical protein
MAAEYEVEAHAVVASVGREGDSPAAGALRVWRLTRHAYILTSCV